MRGRMVLGLCNLPPRAMRGVLSAGMLLCASNDDHTRSANVTSYFAPRGFFAVTFDEGYGGGVALRPVFFQGLKNQPRDWPQPRLFPVYESFGAFLFRPMHGHGSCLMRCSNMRVFLRSRASSLMGVLALRQPLSFRPCL